MIPDYLALSADFIPLAAEQPQMTGAAQWLGLDDQWFDRGVPSWMGEAADVRLIAVRDERMDAETFGRLWRAKVREMLGRGAWCVRVRVEP